MLDLFVENRIEHQQRAFTPGDSRGPAPMLAAIVFEHTDYDLGDLIRSGDGSLPSAFRPIRQKLRLTLIRQRVIE